MELKCMPQPSQGRSHDAAQERKSEPEKESKKSPNTLIELYGAYHNVLWEDGFHKYCVESFIREHDRLLGGEAVDDFQQESSTISSVACATEATATRR